MAHIKGNDLLIALNGTAIAAAKSCDIQTGCDLKEISSPTSSTYRAYKAGRKTWRVTVNFLVNTSGLGVLTMKNIGTTYTLKAYVRNNSSVDYIQGQAILQEAHVTGARGSIVQGSWTFQGTGNI